MPIAACAFCDSHGRRAHFLGDGGGHVVVALLYSAAMALEQRHALGHAGLLKLAKAFLAAALHGAVDVGGAAQEMRPATSSVAGLITSSVRRRPASRSCRRTARTSSWPSSRSGWPATPRWRSSRPRRRHHPLRARAQRREAAVRRQARHLAAPGARRAAGMPRIALPARAADRLPTPGTTSSRRPRRSRAAARAPTTSRCSSTPRAPPARPRA
jgi:hypothetical protein